MFTARPIPEPTLFIRSPLTLEQVESSFDLVATPNEFPSKPIFMGKLAEFFRQHCSLVPTIDNAVFPSSNEYNFVAEHLDEQGIQNYLESYRNALKVTPTETIKREDGSQSAFSFTKFGDTVPQPPTKKSQVTEVYNSIIKNLKNPYFDDWSRRYPLCGVIIASNDDTTSKLCENLETKLRMYVLDVQVAHSWVLATKLVKFARATLGGPQTANGTTIEQVIYSLNQCAAFGAVNQLEYITNKQAEFNALTESPSMFDQLRDQATLTKQLETVLDSNPLAPAMASLYSRINHFCTLVEKAGGALLKQEKQVLTDLEGYGNRKMTQIAEPKTLSDVTKLFDTCIKMLADNHEKDHLQSVEKPKVIMGGTSTTTSTGTTFKHEPRVSKFGDSFSNGQGKFTK